MARLRARVERAAAVQREVAALVAVAKRVLDAYSPAAAPVDQYAEQHHLAAGLRADAAAVAPGWLGAPLDALAPMTPLGGPLPPTFVRVGQAHPLDDARFPVVVPLLRAGHVAIDADARDGRVAGLLRSLVLRLLASSPPGSVRIRTVDTAEVGGTFSDFAGINVIMPPSATDAEGLRTVLDEGEHWVASRAGDGTGPTLLIVIASLPELTEGRDLARIAALAHAGPAGRLHLIAAGWPPPPLTAETTQAPLPHATQIALRNPYAWVGDPPGATYSGTGIGPSRLNAPVYLDPDPPAELVRAVCTQLGGPWSTPPAPTGEPSRTAWLEYVAAGQRLDAVRREAATVVVDQKAALAAAREDLAGVLAKLALHEARVLETAHVAGGRRVELAPTWQDMQRAESLLAGRAASPRRTRGRPLPGTRPGIVPTSPPADPPTTGSTTGWIAASTPPASTPPVSVPPAYAPPASVPPAYAPPASVPPAYAPPASGPPAYAPPASVSPVSAPMSGSIPGPIAEALRLSVATLARSEESLAEPPPAPVRLWLNVLVYLAFALLAGLVQLPLLLTAVRSNPSIGMLAIPCGLALPLMAFWLAWLTIGAVSREPAGRTPLLGAVVSLVALLPLLVLAGVFVVGRVAV